MLNLIVDVCKESDPQKRVKWISSSTEYWTGLGYKLITNSTGPDLMLIHHSKFDANSEFQPGEAVHGQGGAVILVFEAKN